MDAIRETGLWLLFDVSVKSLLLAGLAAIVLRCLPKVDVNLRHRVWTAVLAAMLLLPLLMAITPSVSLPVVLGQSHEGVQAPAVKHQSHRPSVAAPDPFDRSRKFDFPESPVNSEPPPAAPSADVTDAASQQAATQQPIAPPSRRERSFAQGFAAVPWTAVVGNLYLSGVFLLFVRLAFGIWATRRLRRLAVPISQPLNVRAQVVSSSAVRVPVTLGGINSCIVLPVDWAEWGDELLHSVLAHEQAHLDRRDHLVLWTAEINRCLYWFHPLAWFLRRHLARLAEQCCDDTVVESLGNRALYSKHLLEIAWRLTASPQRVAPLGITMARTSAVEFRIDAILDASRPLARRIGRRGALMIVAIAIPFVLLTAALRAGDPQSPVSKAVVGAAPQSKAVDATVPKHSHPKVRADNAATTEPSAENAATDGIVTGVLLKASDQSPVAGARVILRSGQNYYGQSDAKGQFLIEEVPPNPYGYEIWAHQGNLVAQKTPVPQLQTAASDVAKFAPLRLEMMEGKQAKFVVTSKITGQLIPAAMIGFGYPDRRKVETDRAGTAVVSGLLSQSYDVTIEALGHAREARQIDLSNAEPVSEYRITLAEGGLVRGVVVDEAGQPVAEAEVVYRESTGSGYHGDAFRTNAQGHFRHRFLPLNEPLKVSVQKDKYIDQERDFVLTMSQREMDFPITLARRPESGVIAGTVTDRSNRPVVAATVANYDNRSEPNATATTDARGQFLLGDFVASSTGYEIVVQANGYAPQRLSVEPGTRERPSRVAVKLEPGHAVHGRVVDEQGKPMRQAFVSVRSAVYPSGLGSTIRIDEEGNFAFNSIPADARFDVFLPSYARLFNILLKLDGTEPIVVTLEPAASIRGIVVDAESGKPLSQFSVRLSFSRVKQPNDPQGTYPSELEQGVTFKSDVGHFSIGPLTNGMPLEVTIEAEGYQRGVVPRAVASKTGTSDDLKITLKPIDDVGLSTLRGQLLDFKGNAVSGAQLRLIVSTEPPLGLTDNSFNWELIKNGQLARKPNCDQFLSRTTDSQGRFEFQKIHAGKYLQLAYWGNGVPQGRSLAFDKTRPGTAEKATIKLPQPATIRGSFDRSKFPEAGSIRLSRNQEAWQSYEIKLNEDQSTFEFRDLPAGYYDLVIAAKPVRFSENGTTFFRISTLSGTRFPLNAGESREVTFVKPDKPQE